MDYKIKHLKNRDFIVNGNNQKIYPYKNSFNKKHLNTSNNKIFDNTFDKTFN